MSGVLLSVVSPVYEAEGNVAELVRQIREAANHVEGTYEVLLVEDGSTDGSWDAICREAEAAADVRGVRLSRNFGQHMAITAGLEHARGDYVVVMDCDLQDDPKYIPELLRLAQQGNDIVYTRKSRRAHSFAKNITAWFFGAVSRILIPNETLHGQGTIGAYSILSRKVVEAFKEFGDYRRHYLQVLRWLGFRSAFLDIEHRKRFAGRSSYTWFRLVEHGITGILSHSDRLLRLNVIVGVGLATLAGVAAVVVVIFKLTHDFQAGWASLMTMMLFSLGAILASIGVAGFYIGRVFEQVKDRPRYIVDEVVGDTGD